MSEIEEMRKAKKIQLRIFTSTESPALYYIGLCYLDEEGKLLHKTPIAKQMVVDMLVGAAMLEDQGFKEMEFFIDQNEAFRLSTIKNFQERMK